MKWPPFIAAGIVVAGVIGFAFAQSAPSDFPGGQYNSTPIVLADKQTARLQMDASGYLLTTNGTPGTDQDVNLVGINGGAPVTGSGTATGALRVELPTNGTGVIATVGAVTAITNALPAGTNGIGKLTANSGIDIGDVTLTAGSALVGSVSIDQTTPATTNAIVATPTSVAGAALANVVSTAVETGHIIKGSPGNLYGWSVTTGAAAGRVLVHNTTTVPSAGAVTPVDCAIVAANSTVSAVYPMPLRLGTGISISFSTATTCFTQTDSATAFITGQAS